MKICMKYMLSNEVLSRSCYIRFVMTIMLWMVFLFLFSTNPADAQAFHVRGVVMDKSKSPLPYCNVALKTQNDSTFIVGCITDDKGFFTLSVPKGYYMFHVSYVGYDDYSKSLTVKGNMRVDTVTMNESSVALAELTVKGKRVQRNSLSDVYYLNGSTKTVGRNALEVISLASGVTVDHRKGIRIYGKEGTKVVIDGRMLELSGESLNKYLANIKGEDIASMEVVKTTNATYDANATGGVIKIKLRKHVGNGYDASVGINSKMRETTFLGVKPDFSINSQIGKFNIYGNLSYSNISKRETDTEESVYKGRNTGIATSTIINDKIPTDSYFARLGVLYRINDKHTIGVDGDFTANHDREEMHTPSMIKTNDVTKNYYTNYYTPQTVREYNGSLNYIWSISESGSELNVGADYYYQSNRTGDDNTLTCQEDSSFLKKTLSTVEYNRTMYTGGFDFKMVCSSVMTLDVGAKYNHTTLKDYLNYRYKDGIDGVWTTDAESTDDTEYREDITAGFVNANYKIGLWTLEGGLRYESTFKRLISRNFSDKNSSNTYGNLFPMMTATYDINKDKGHVLTLKYHSGISRPSFDQLVPFQTQQNLFTYVVGSPYLSPSYNYSAGADLLLFNAFYLGADYTREKDKVEMIIEPRDADGLMMNASYKNINQYDTYSMQTFVPIPVTKDIYFGLTLMGSHKRRQMYGGTTDKLWQFYSELEANVEMAGNFSFETTFSYLNRDFYGNMLLKDYYVLNFALRKSFLNKRLQVSLIGTNILGKPQKLYIDDQYIYRTVTMKRPDECSLFSLSVQYHFSNDASIKHKRVKAFNTEERER